MEGREKFMEMVVIFFPLRNLKKKKKIKALFILSFTGLITG